MTLRPLEIGLGTLVMAAAATGVYGQCSNDAGVGDVAEAEACLGDLDEDLTNGGCNSTPPVFTIVPSLPVTFCGSASTYDIDTDGDGVVRVTSDVVGEPGLDLVTLLVTGDFDATCTASSSSWPPGCAAAPPSSTASSVRPGSTTTS